jgi:uncharacterized protein (TIGR02466 family)
MITEHKNIKHSIFSTPIWGVMLHDQKYQIKDYVEKIFEIECTEESQKKSNFGGYQTKDNLHEIPVFKELTTGIEKIVNEAILSEYKVPSYLVIKEMWANINYKHCFNYSHIHGECLSGVFYLDVPPNSGNLILVNPAVRSTGKLFENKNFLIKPEKYACIFFPSWLEHYVEPNLSDEKRISISFNIGIIS